MCAAGGELDHVHRPVMTKNEAAVLGRRFRTAIQRPQADRTVPACRCQEAAVIRKGEVHNLALVARQDDRFRILVRQHVFLPQIDPAVIACGRKQLAVWRESGGIHRGLMRIEGGFFSDLRSRPYNRGIVEAG